MWLLDPFPSNKLVRDSRNIDLLQNSKLMSFDLCNLFPSIPSTYIRKLEEDLFTVNLINSIIKAEI